MTLELSPGCSIYSELQLSSNARAISDDYFRRLFLKERGRIVSRPHHTKSLSAENKHCYRELETQLILLTVVHFKEVVVYQ